MNRLTKIPGAADLLRRLYHNNRAARSVLTWPVALRRRVLSGRGAKAYTIVKRLGDVIVDDVVLTLPEFLGQFAMSAKSDLFRRVAIDGVYESEMTKLVRRYLVPTRDFIDIGANVGFYSVMAARLLDTGRVLAVEPNQEAHSRLLQNLERNGVTNKVIVFQGLASNQLGEATLYHIPGMEEYSSMGKIIHSSVRDKSAVTSSAPTSTVDSLVAEHELNPGFIKIDVEGAEMLVLAGSIETLKRHRPIVLSELSPALLGPMGSSAEAIISLFESLRYTVTDANDPKLRPGTRDYGDILCVPEEIA